TNITVQTSAQAILPSTFNFSSSLAQFGLSNGTYIADSALKGTNEIDLGNSATQSVTLDSGAALSVPIVKIAANSSITLQAGAQINAVSNLGDGAVSLATNGVIRVQAAAGGQPDALVHASDSIFIQAGSLDYQGGIQVDHGSLTLATQAGVNMTFVPGSGTQPASGFAVSQNLWSRFNSIDNVILQSGGNLVFQGSIDLTAKQSFSIDSARIVGQSDSQGNVAVVGIEAPVINVFNVPMTQVMNGINLANTGYESGAPLVSGPGAI